MRVKKNYPKEEERLTEREKKETKEGENADEAWKGRTGR